jgi:hypothetical protein
MGFASAIQDGVTGPTALNDLTVRDNDFQATSSAKIINHSNGYKASEETWENNSYYNSQSAANWFAIQNAVTSLASWQSKVEPTAVNEQVKYPDPGRTIGSYNASLGGTTSRDAFLDEAAEQNKADWDTDYTAKGLLNYLRAGFTGVTVDGPTTPTPTEPSTPTTPPPPTTPDDSSKPTAALAATGRTASGTSSHQIKVTYVDDVAVQVNSIGNTDLTVTGPNGYTQAATLAKLDYTTNGKVRVATYNVAAPGGSWEASDDGTYTVKMNTIGVRDTDANYVAAGTLGTFNADIVGIDDDLAAPTPTNPGAADTTPPSVAWSNFDPATQTVMVKFTEDVSASLNTGDLRLKNTKTGELITYSSMTLSYDKNTNTATWSIDAPIAEANYKVMLSWGVVSDAAGNKLDGNGDGDAGDDHVFYISASEIAAITQIASSDPLAPALG